MPAFTRQIAFFTALCLVGGCAQVEPASDYARTSESLRLKTGAASVYQPDLEHLIADRVSSLLADGMTIDEAVQIGLLNNPSFQAAFAGVGVSRADVVQSGLLSNPSLGFSPRFPEGGGRTNLTLTIAQEIVDLWQIPVRRSIAEAQLEQTILAAVNQGVELAAEIRTRYLQLWAFQSTIEISRQNEQLVQVSLALAEKRLKAGEATQLDVNLLRASLLDVQTGLIILRRDQAVAHAQLARSLGLSRSALTWTLTDPFSNQIPGIPDEVVLLEFGFQERVEVRIAEQKVRAALAELKKQYLSIVPSLSWGVEWERNERRALPGRKVLADTAISSIRAGRLTAPDIETRGQRNRERRQIIDSLLGPSLQITLPLWDQNQAQIAKAMFKLEQSRKEYDALLDDVARQVDESLAGITNSAELVKFFDQQSLPQATDNLNLTRKSYEAGEQNVIVLIEAQQSLISQRLSAENVRRDYYIALVGLERALGGRLPPTTSQPVDTPERTQP
jgi:cobalt-zinc-cadmium efflux system outer membrane protein